MVEGLLSSRPPGPGTLGCVCCRQNTRAGHSPTTLAFSLSCVSFPRQHSAWLAGREGGLAWCGQSLWLGWAVWIDGKGFPRACPSCPGCMLSCVGHRAGSWPTICRTVASGEQSWRAWREFCEWQPDAGGLLIHERQKKTHLLGTVALHHSKRRHVHIPCKAESAQNTGPHLRSLSLPLL